MEEKHNVLDIDWITYPLILLYCWPLLGICYLGYSTSMFAVSSDTIIALSKVLSYPAWNNSRTIIESIAMPFLTAYSITTKINIQTAVPFRTYGIFLLLIGFLVIALISAGMVAYAEPSLEKISLEQGAKNAHTILHTTSWAYVGYLLTYIALVLGISLAKPKQN